MACSTRGSYRPTTNAALGSSLEATGTLETNQWNHCTNLHPVSFASATTAVSTSSGKRVWAKSFFKYTTKERENWSLEKRTISSLADDSILVPSLFSKKRKKDFCYSILNILFQTHIFSPSCIVNFYLEALSFFLLYFFGFLLITFSLRKNLKQFE